MPITAVRMPLLEHLGELRRRLTIILAALLGASVVVYFFTPQLIEFLVAPVRPFLPDGATLSSFDPLGPFSVRFRVAMYGAAIVTSPVIIWQILAFFLPALKPRERKWAVPTFFAALVLFILGNVFCYLVILSTAFEWMLGQTGGVIDVIPNVDSYIKSITFFQLGFGLAFELPLVVFYLVVFDIVSYKKLRSSWRTVYLVLMTLSAVATPDASPVTMLLMFGALAALYEISLAASYVVSGKRREARLREDIEFDED